MANKSEFKAIVKSAERQGWTITPGRKHVKWQAPSGQVVFSSATPSDHRAVLNHLSLLRRHGYVG